MAAKKKPVRSLCLDDLGMTADAVGPPGARSSVVGVSERPARAAGTVVYGGNAERAGLLTDAMLARAASQVAGA